MPGSKSPSPPVRRILAIGSMALGPAAALAQIRPGARICLPSLSSVAALLENGLGGTVFVVVDSEAATTEELLAVAQAGAEGSPDLALGFLYGRGQDQLFGVVRRFCTDPPVAPRDAAQHLFSAPDQPISLRAARLLWRNPAPDLVDEVVARITELSELLFLVGHANAMHLTVGGAVLCRRSTVRVEPDQVRVYPCFHGDPCFFSRNRGEVEVPIDRLSARRAILLSCFGVSPIDTTFAPAYGIGEGLLHHAAIETLITPLRAASLSEADLAIVYFLCNSGLPMGAVANRANSFRLVSGSSAEILCFGDAESRLENTLTTVACHRDSELLYIEPGESDGTAKDFVAALPAQPLPAEPILVDETAGQVLSATIDPNGFLYASVPSDWKGQPLRFRLVGRTDLADIGGAGRQLLSDLAFLDVYLPLIVRLNGESAALAETLKAHSSLQELLHGWPLLDLPVGTRIEERQITVLWRELRCRVEDLADRFAALYVHLMTEDQRTHPTPWDSRYHTVAAERGKVACGYCSHGIDEFEAEARLGSARRSWGLCRSTCAYVYDGDPALGRWLGLPAQLTPGETCDVTLATRNPYRIPLGARVVGVLKNFQPGRSQPSLPAWVELQPGEERTIAFRIEVPSSLRQGIYHLSACLTVGTKTNFYRAQVQVGRARSDAEAGIEMASC
jgi:hypothetical protein